MDELFSALGIALAWMANIIDPLCGPVGIFTWFGNSTLLACGATGWGDEIAAGLQVTVAVALQFVSLMPGSWKMTRCIFPMM